MKIIEVYSCGECPYREYPNMVCTRTMNKFDSMSDIPEWCPLEDDPE